MIETDRLLIRNFTENDWQDLKGYISKDEVVRFEPGWDPSEDACRKRVKELARRSGFWAVELKSAGKMIGHIIFDRIPPMNLRTWMIGYIFDSDFYGNGYATEACKAIISYGFNDLEIHRVMAKCSPENTRSWRLLERIGMRREGHLKKSLTFNATSDGEPIWWDEYLYAILREEWHGEENVNAGHSPPPF